MSKTLTKPIKWHGGKDYLADWIISHFPARCKNPNNPSPDDPGWLHYVEPFFGGGSVLLAQDPEGISEVANDINLGLSNFWRVLSIPSAFELFRRRAEAAPFSELLYNVTELTKAIEYKGDGTPEENSVNAAYSFFINCRQSMSGRMKSFAPLTRNRTRRGMNEQASAWLNAIEGLPAVHTRLKRVVILNRTACEVIQQQDGPRTLFYLDPPYLHSTRATTGEYEHEMSEAEHAGMLGILAGIKGRFVLSGYPSDLYDKVAAKAKWRRVDKLVDNKSSSAKVKEKKIECLWMNY